MSNNKMLIDATHPEETRVVVLRSGRVEEFDYESAARKLLRGNIYLAKVTRVEPSLQAAFVEYGGNRHGFLAFNEIHPDYYQIPMADRQALLDEEAAAEAREEAEVDAHAERLARRQRGRGGDRNRRGSSGPAPGTGEQPHIFHVDDAPHDEAGEEGRASDHDAAHTLAERALDADDVIREDVTSDDAEDAGERAALAEIDDIEPDAHEDEVEDNDNDNDPDAELDDDQSDADDHDHDDDDDEAGEEGTPASHSQSDTADASDTREGDDGAAEGNIEVVVPAAKDSGSEVETVEPAGSEDALEELPSRPRRRLRSYKIQEVIKRRQVILVQVVKEERGNKGAALTTYLSLAGRYTVLMPNTARGGGISRKITQPQDRKRLKAIAQELEVPEGMGLIIRTAGAARTKQEIKRDFEYLLRLWESVRDLTLQSTAPSLVYEEGNLIKRSIRDLYNKDVDEIVVAGDDAHHEARDFMRMLMPSHAKNVLQHSDPEPLFTRYGIERQLNAMFSPYVTLRSGGYLVINQTEALVAIDVNSGKSTREFSIEETALNTNLEASDEIARQLKLRDLAGLVVIDFIDMEEKRNNRAVERRLKDALRFDRARIQLGRISHFGLMEMSRQRMRTGVLEGSTSQCPHCQGTGIIRSTESVALAVLRGLEDALMAGARTSLVATTTSTVALYLLNNKRPYINEMEARHSLTISIHASDKLQGANFTIEKGHASVAAPARRDRPAAVNMDWGFEGDEDADEANEDAGEVVEVRSRNGGAQEARGEDDEGGRSDGRRRRRRRRGRRGDRDGDNGGRQQMERNGSARELDDEDGEDDAVVEITQVGDVSPDDDQEGDGEDRAAAPQGSGEREAGRRRRRGRRGGRRGRDRGDRERGSYASEAADDLNGADSEGRASSDHGDAAPVETKEPAVEAAVAFADVGADAQAAQLPTETHAREAAVEPKTSVREKAPAKEPAAALHAVSREDDAPAAAKDEPKAEAAPKPRRSTTSSEPKLERVVVSPEETVAADVVEADAPAVATRRGWWQRR